MRSYLLPTAALLTLQSSSASLRGFFNNASSTLTTYSESAALHQLDLCQASYCVGTLSWTCKTCVSGVTLEAVIEVGGGRALVGYDSTTASLFVAYRGSENIQNWLDNVKFVHTSPYPEYPNVQVEKGFWEWYQNLKSGVDSALQASAAKHGVTKVTLTGHSAGAAVATLHAFDIARGEDFTAGLTLKALINFGSPRVGDSNFATTYESIINQNVIPNWRVTHYYDMVPHVPEEMLGYHHVTTEVWYNEPSSSYKVCDSSGEDPTCSDSCAPTSCTSIDDHLDYLNVPLGSSAC